MKAAPVINALARQPGVTQVLVHTGQHYDANMSDIFFRQLGLPEPDINLEVGSASHAVQTAQIMTAFEQVVGARRPDWVVVYGDVNSTVAAALVCAKLLIPVAHVEAGLRSFDRTMPEEINRLLTDQLADLLFTPSADGDENLRREGVAAEKIQLVGNVMIDTLVRLLPQAEARWPALQTRFGLGRFGLVTLHRPSNVDAPDSLRPILQTLGELSRELPLLFPVHPRTRQRIAAWGLEAEARAIQFVEPLGYLEFLALQKAAALVITDSGGIQEETTYLGVPCLTVRENT
ncbi:MAG: UDP-N-acetylglucosamine 2-epimerase (non-hydrolyzing), partial [Anaerolineales bacterium]|nr:UDP-N-acetylglucosamine 2-epimerase (non-hydrolyzing) [Anaerolineales bacterium]